MVSALNGFGLAIGSMDIIGAIFFELMIICMLCRRNSKQVEQQEEQEEEEEEEEEEETNVATAFGKGIGRRMLWTYVILLNIWILSSLLLLIGIVWHKPNLLLFWLVWCLGGLFFDVIFMLWWFWELILGDTIEALTNILISLLTMSIEFGFIYVVYNIYKTLVQSPNDQAALNNNHLLQLAYVLF